MCSGKLLWPLSGEMDGASLALQAHLSECLEEVDRTLPPLIRPFARRSLRAHCLVSSLQDQACMFY